MQDSPLPADLRVAPPARRSLLRPFCLGHGTLECRDLTATRRFYEEFLGLECVRHSQPAMAFRLGMRFHVVCVEVGDQVHPVNVLNHWGLDVATREEVDQAHRLCHEHAARYGIRQILEVQEMHGVYSFYFEDLDHNWWEIQHYEGGFCHDDYFDFGDRFAMAPQKVPSPEAPSQQVAPAQVAPAQVMPAQVALPQVAPAQEMQG